MRNSNVSVDMQKHVRGESRFIDDHPVPSGTLFAVVADSPVAHGRIKSLSITDALNVSGVVSILTSKDIPGENQIGGIIEDESLLAGEVVHFIGEPVALVIAESILAAKKARSRIRIECEALPVITDPREAVAKGNLLIPPRTFQSGDPEMAFKECAVVVEGRADSGGQEHLYLETQGSLAIPEEGGRIRIISSTQGPTAVQKATARVLGIPMNKIEVDVLRLGGGFGGKEDQASAWGALAALGAFKVKRPVKLVLSRHDDLRMTGKRHPYSSDYKLGLTAEGKILAYEAVYYQDGGACADLSPAIMERTLLHATNSYAIPNVKTTAYSAKTNVAPNTAFRGFGGPQGKFVIEAAIRHASEMLGIPAYEIQRKNLIQDGDSFYYGQKVTDAKAVAAWQKADEEFHIKNTLTDVEAFNASHSRLKKGMAVMPICFGISFTSTFLNQASALIHIYTDGSVSVSTAAVEMGQGVNQKIKTVVARVLSVSPERISIETTNTARVANTSPTAASSGADLNGNAAMLAAKELKKRLIAVAATILKTSEDELTIQDEVVIHAGKKTEITWNALIFSAYVGRVSLSAQAYYATPNISFDRTINKGTPFAYHVYGTSITTATVDCLTGIYTVDAVRIVHDFGQSLNKVIDLGQAEGALMQGIGWMTMEEIRHNKDGRLLANSLSTYKVPDIYATPDTIDIRFLEGSYSPTGPMNSKAIGEPPFMYGIGAYFALYNAMKAYKPDAHIPFSAPLTPEKVLMALTH